MSNSYYENGANHYDHHKELHIGQVNGGDVGKLISAFLKDDAEEAEIVNEADCRPEGISPDTGHQLLANDIFVDELLNTHERLVALRDTIKSGITGQDCLDMASGKEWYWLYAALNDAGVLETRRNRRNAVTDTGFVKQIAKWFHPIVGDMDDARIRKICKSMSAERNKWTMNGKEISLIDLEANKRRITSMKETKISRIILVAYDGMYRPLMELKQKWEKATR